MKNEKNLYFGCNKLLVKTLLYFELIKPIEEEVFEKLDNFYLGGIPLSIRLKYLHNTSLGDCFDRSLFLTFGLKDSLLIRGDLGILALKYGKDRARHGWVEYDGWVYDPSYLYKFRKDVYYSLFSVDNISCTKRQIYENNHDYQDILTTTLEDLKPDGKKRKYVEMSLYSISSIANLIKNDDLTEKLDEHFSRIRYDNVSNGNKCLVKR